jgi:hypothetical protein
MAQCYPESPKACHLNFVASLPPPITSPFSYMSFLVRHFLGFYTAAEAEGLTRTRKSQEIGMGYYHLQTSRPQTIGYLLADSPTGLLAWIYDKLHEWSEDYPWTDDEICTWASMYWFSEAGPAASVRIYYENVRGDIPSKPGGYLHGVKLVTLQMPKR